MAPFTKEHMTRDQTFPAWMKFILLAAAFYNLAWGSWVIFRPNDMFNWTGIPRPLYPGIWQCVGMIVGVYGIGYAVAAFNPIKHWPIVLVGFLGKTLGPIGMLQNVLIVPPGTPGRLPASWLWLNLTNDVIWWIPFGAILYTAFQRANEPTNSQTLGVAKANRSVISQHGESLSTLSGKSNVLVVLLRHSGCTFCREALADIAARRTEIESEATIALVHMGEKNESTQAYFDRYGLGDVHRFSDPECQLYRAYELGRGKLSQLFGPSIWWRGFQAGIISRHAIGKLGGDGFQLAGTFLIRDDRIIKSFRHLTAADRPDYCKIAAMKTD